MFQNEKYRSIATAGECLKGRHSRHPIAKAALSDLGLSSPIELHIFVGALV